MGRGKWEGRTYLQVVHIGCGEQKTTPFDISTHTTRNGDPPPLTRQTNRTDKPDIHHALMTETNGPEINFILRREPNLASQMRWRKEDQLSGTSAQEGKEREGGTYIQVDQECRAFRKLEVYPVCKVCRLLEED